LAYLSFVASFRTSLLLVHTSLSKTGDEALVVTRRFLVTTMALEKQAIIFIGLGYHDETMMRPRAHAIRPRVHAMRPFSHAMMRAL